ncbi:MAG: trehalose-6-phosphate synthase, partial [Kiritimatiellae bacterium]|nr:trehalose-6-phosphate synthase [Kiritimatiellia bacterium]
MSPQSEKKIRSFRSMRLTLRFIIPLVIAMTLLAYALLPLVDKLALHWFTRDLDMRSQLIANTIQEPLGDFLAQENTYRINSLMKRAIQDERLFAMGFCDAQGKLL